MSKHPTTSNHLGLMVKLAVEEKSRPQSMMPPLDGTSTELVVDWAQNDNGRWCHLDDLDFAHPYFNGLAGVYIIWTSTGRCVRVGQGQIAEKLAVHRQDPAIRSASLFSPLFVTWSAVPAQLRDGVERYLEARFKPATGARGLDVELIKVNDPTI